MRRNLTDVDALKALAHPLRQQMFTHLNRYGPATCADLAAAFGADRGGTSYHLRQLARYEFIEEDHSAGRRRYWRAKPLDLRLPYASEDPEISAASDAISRGWIEQAQRDLFAFLADKQSHGEFGEAAMNSFGNLTLNADELREFGEAYIVFLNGWHREPTPGSRAVTVLFNAFPTPS
ncbi:MAG TPA: helix-turn-helix domain-containing protein [Actinoplanes sp.]|nr:helix-turn-helix domain-containing protein [Actinoplanes sp.]